jgi:thiol:disulfide interchange protein DsbD
MRSDTTAPGGEGATAGAQSEASHRLRGALEKGGLWWFLVLFLGGLALNLTPCVFPMLGITVSVFGARRRERPGKVLAHAVAYVLGIAVTYSVLGVVAALTGGLFGSALQNPWVNVGLGLLFIVLSLSMFGLYEMQPPGWVLQRLGGADATSLLGIFLSGLAVGIIAAPCVGPFVVAVLALLAQRGDARFGFETMFAMSLGLGFPYLFLALFSNLIQGLPRSGDWMLWVKKVFGVLLAAIGLYYALVGLAPRLAEWILPAALLLGGSYLGFLDRHGSARPVFRRFKRTLGALALLAGVAAIVTLRAEGIRFQPYDESALQAALAAGRPVLLEFSADWCVPCHELDRATFTDRRVIERSRDFVVFKVDLTRYDSPGSRTLRARYGVTGVPEILLFAPGRGEVREARVIGFIPPRPFLERLEGVLAGGRPATP